MALIVGASSVVLKNEPIERGLFVEFRLSKIGNCGSPRTMLSGFVGSGVPAWKLDAEILEAVAIDLEDIDLHVDLLEVSTVRRSRTLPSAAR